MSELKIVTIKVKPNPRIPAEVWVDTKAYLGSGYDSETNDVLRGLTLDEEKVLLPNLVGCTADSPDFNDKTRHFWNNIDMEVDATLGRKLNVTTELKDVEFLRNGVKVKEKMEIPRNPIDYINYRLALKHSEVAGSLAECKARKQFQFYIEDLHAETKSKAEALVIRNKARAKYLEIAGGEVKDDAVLRAIAVAMKDVHNMTIPSSKDGLLIFIEEISEKYPEAFTSTASDPHLKDRAFVMELLNYNIITSVANSIFDEALGIEAVAENLDAYIKYINLEGKTTYKGQKKAQLQAKKGK